MFPLESLHKTSALTVCSCTSVLQPVPGPSRSLLSGYLPTTFPTHQFPCPAMETLGHPAVPLGLWVLRVQRRNLNSLETEKEELSAAPWAEILFYTFSEKKTNKPKPKWHIPCLKATHLQIASTARVAWRFAAICSRAEPHFPSFHP